MQKFINLKNYLLELSFLALLIKVLYSGAGIGEALVFISLVVSMAYNKWLHKTEEDKYKDILNKLSEYEVETQRKLDNITAKMVSQNIGKTYSEPKKLMEANNEQEQKSPKRYF